MERGTLTIKYDSSTNEFIAETAFVSPFRILPQSFVSTTENILIEYSDNCGISHYCNIEYGKITDPEESLHTNNWKTPAKVLINGKEAKKDFSITLKTEYSQFPDAHEKFRLMKFLALPFALGILMRYYTDGWFFNKN